MVPTHLRRPAFRLGEVLVTTIIVLIVIGLLLPLLPQARDDGGRTQCINNNKQLGLAVHEYAGAHQLALPPLSCDMARPKYGDYNGGIFVTLLPYLEEEDLFKKGRFEFTELHLVRPRPA